MEKPEIIVSYLKRLIERSCPDADARRKETTMRLCTRMLGSRISVGGGRDAFAVTRKMRRHIKRGKEGAEVIKAKIARFDALARRATSNALIHKKWASLYLLYALRDSAKMEVFSGDGATTRAESIVSVSAPPKEESKSFVESGKEMSSTVAPSSSAADPSEMLYAQPKHRRKFDWGLTHWRVDEETSFQDSEQLLLRDIIFALQGIDGTYIKYRTDERRFAVVDALSLPLPTRRFVENVCEGGALYKRIKNCLDRYGDASFSANAAADVVVGSDGGRRSLRRNLYGRVRRSFCESVRGILAEYFRLLAVLEAQIAQTSLTNAAESKTETEVDSSALTLRRLNVWLVEPIEKLRVLAELCESTASAAGGALASATFLHVQHGDASVQNLVSDVMEALSAPLFEIMFKWVSDGVLDDPFEEFFVRTNENADGWNQRYCLVPQMIPRFISMPLAKMILLLGKSIYFVRNCCMHARGGGSGGASKEATSTTTTVVSWQELRRAHVHFDRDHFKYGQQWDNGRLHRSISLATKTISSQLVDLLFKQHRLMDHLFALKQYLLLGRGDFALCLMDALQPELKARASSIFRHNLVAKLEHAIRSSSAQFDDPAILKRLDVRLLEASPGEEGWDIFLLDYRIQKVAGIGSRTRTPLSAVITADAMKSYHKVFTFLWQLKRVEHSLVTHWKSHIDVAKTAVASGVGPAVSDVVHRCRVLHHEMMHFVSNLHNYIMFEVLQTSWEELAREMPAANDLDSVIRAHETYLRKVLSKVLVDKEAQEVRGLLNKVFDLIVHFCKTEQRMYVAIGQATAALRRHREAAGLVGKSGGMRLKTKAPRRRRGGGEDTSWGITPEMELKSAARREALVRKSRVFSQELNELQVDYTRHIRNLLFILREKYSRSENLQFLAFRLDFNTYYATAFGGGEDLDEEDIA
eukprot:g1292.t1